MKVLVLNGSPKGKYSITLQTVNYLEARYPQHSFEVIHVGQRIHALEKDFAPVAQAAQQADLLLFAYPVYTFIAPCQLHRCIELLKESGVSLAGKYATQITTSKHFYDVTAHRYVEDNCHDLGLKNGRERHHLDSGHIIRNDSRLTEWFSAEQIEIIAQAAEDHRASGKSDPRSIYGMIVAEADRVIDGETIIRRTLQYGFTHYPSLDREAHIKRAVEHLREKYGRGGYLKLWIPWSDNAIRLSALQDTIADDSAIYRETARIIDSLV